MSFADQLRNKANAKIAADKAEAERKAAEYAAEELRIAESHRQSGIKQAGQIIGLVEAAASDGKFDLDIPLGTDKTPYVDAYERALYDILNEHQLKFQFYTRYDRDFEYTNYESGAGEYIYSTQKRVMVWWGQHQPQAKPDDQYLGRYDR